MFNYNITLTAIKAGHDFRDAPLSRDGKGTPYELTRDALRNFCFVQAGYAADECGKILWFKNKSSLTLVIDGHRVAPDHIYRDCVMGAEIIPCWKGPA